jgi:hypothetical protein
MRLFHKIFLVMGAGLVTLNFAACTSTTPQENYADSMRSKIGTNFDVYSRLMGREQIQVRTLENGNIKYQYPYAGGHCMETYEVDSKTRIILSATYSGSERACQLSP